MKIDQNKLYRLIVEEYLTSEGYWDHRGDDAAEELLKKILGDKYQSPEERGATRHITKGGDTAPMKKPHTGADETMPVDLDIPSGDAPLEDRLMDLIQGLPPEEVADLFQAVFEKIPGVELGEPEEEPPETLYSPGAEGRPQVGFREELMEIIKEELQEFMGRPRPRYGEGNLTIDDVRELLPQLSPGEQTDVWEKYKHLNNQDDLRRALRMNEEENNPWAICTASVGREDKEKYEKCVKSVKKQNRGEK